MFLPAYRYSTINSNQKSKLLYLRALPAIASSASYSYTGFAIAVSLFVTIYGMEKAAVQILVEAAYVVYLYFNATRGNVAVTLAVV